MSQIQRANFGKHKPGFMSDKLSNSLWTGEKQIRYFRTDANELLILGRKFSVTIWVYFYEFIRCEQNTIEAQLLWQWK